MRYIHFDETQKKRKGSTICLSLVFFAGYGLGILCCIYADNDAAVSAIRNCFSASVSVLDAAFFLLLPYLLSIAAVAIDSSRILYSICFLESFATAYLALGFYKFFGAGWLLHGILMFSDRMFLPVLYGFWHHHISGDHKLSLFSLISCAFSGILCVFIGFYYIVPYGVNLYLQKG